MLLLVIKATILGVFLLPPFLRNKKTTYIILGSFMTVKFGNFRTFWKGLSSKEADQYSFFRIPKVLYTNSAFKNLSFDAKVLYGILLDRMGLSVKNSRIDSENRVFIIFTVEEIMETLNVSNKTAGKIGSVIKSL